jgi:hypothetical protein
MSRMAQPYQSLGVELASPLAAEPQSGANLTIEGRGMTIQAIASDDDIPQTGRQALEQGVESAMHLSCFPNLFWGRSTPFSEEREK